jgi:DNA-3-methyladenine glycosylase I
VSDLLGGADGRTRCSWPVGDPLYEEYHDAEWGRPVDSDEGLFERIVLEGFQAGLSWITILRKRDAFRAAFAGFDPAAVSRFDDDDVERLLGDAAIVRNRAKIAAAIGNASRALDLIAECGSLARFFGGFAPAPPPAPPKSFADLPAVTEESRRLSAALKDRGWSFVGPTTMYALMQSVGLVNDHLVGCFVRDRVDAEQRQAPWAAQSG